MQIHKAVADLTAFGLCNRFNIVFEFFAKENKAGFLSSELAFMDMELSHDNNEIYNEDASLAGS